MKIKYFYLMTILMMSGCTSLSEKSMGLNDQPLVQISPETPAPSEPAGFEDISLSQKRRLQALTSTMEIEKETENYVNNGQADIITRPDGTVLYPYGLSEAALTAKRMMYTKIILQEGEKIMSVQAGDTIRWNILPNYMGNTNSYTPVVLVKPFVGGLQTSLSIITDRRDYDISLHSVNSGDYTSRIGFYYPQDRADSIKVALPPDKMDSDISHQPHVNIENIKYDYRIKGDRHLSWYPQSIFEDGQKVFIRMPDKVNQGQLPILMTIDQSGVREMVNYRYFKPYYVVDTLFDQGVLILGTDKYQHIVKLMRV